VKSKRLIQLTKSTAVKNSLASKDEQLLFPDYEPILDEFEQMIVWKRAGTQSVPEPQVGVDPEFDRCNEKVESVKHKLGEYLVEVQ